MRSLLSLISRNVSRIIPVVVAGGFCGGILGLIGFIASGFDVEEEEEVIEECQPNDPE